jgi:diguanylate cyclase (GGDEF)-like protein/PAS domain S-box-containing protein
MAMIKNKKIYLIGGLFLIIGVLIAGVLFLTGPIPIKNISYVNSDLLLKTTKLNKDIRRIISGLDKVIYDSALKPSLSQKTRFKTALNNLKSSFKKTNKQYKELDVFIKKNSTFLNHNRRVAVYFNKSYYKWKNISEPILKVIIKYPKYISSKISYEFFLKRTLYFSHLPTENIIKDTQLYFIKLINIAIYMTIIGTIVILFLGILFIYYMNKFYKAISQSEQRFKSFFYNLSLTSFIIDVETGFFIDANNSAIKFYGYSRDELLNMNIEKINISNSPQELKVFRRTAAAKGSEVIIFKHKLKNEQIKIIQSYMVTITLNNKLCLLAVILDITEKVKTENALRESEELFKMLAENMMTGLILYNEKFIYVNPTVERVLGYTQDELYQKFVWDIYPEEKDKELIKVSTKKRLNGEMLNDTYTLKVLTKQNKEIWILASVSTVKYKGKFAGIATAIDVTETINLRNALEQERDLFRVLIENIRSGIALYSKDKFLYLNSAILDLFHYTKEEFLNLNVNDFFNIKEDRLYYSNTSIFTIYVNKETSPRFIYKYKDSDKINTNNKASTDSNSSTLGNIDNDNNIGNSSIYNSGEDGTLNKADNNKVRYIDLFRTVITYNNEQTSLAIFTDVTDQILKEQHILVEKETYKELSEIDALTGINNRRSFDNKLIELLNTADRYNRPLSLIMFDIDKFKDVNDMYGHETGDFILKELSAITKESLRTTDFFARYGGEEFMIIAPETPLSTARGLAERLRSKIEKYDFNIGQPVTCSFGITEIKSADISHSIIFRADGALYEAKGTGRNKVCYE